MFSDTEIKERNTLLGYARRRLIAGSQPTAFPSVSVDPSLDPVLGSYFCGNEVRLRASLGLASFETQAVITEIKTEVDENGNESTDLTFANSGAV